MMRAKLCMFGISQSPETLANFSLHLHGSHFTFARVGSTCAKKQKKANQKNKKKKKQNKNKNKNKTKSQDQNQGKDKARPS